MKSSPGFWLLVGFLALLLLLLGGQLVGLGDYPLAVELGLQESEQQVGAYGVAVNQAFCTADSLIYIPLVLTALVALLQRRAWALPITAAVLGISAYWPITSLAMLLRLPGASGYQFEVPGFYWPLLCGIALCSLIALIGLLRVAQQPIQ